VVWHEGDTGGNLGGTISSWNEVSPADFLTGRVQDGVLGRGGWAVLDDAGIGRFDDDSSAPRWVDGSPWVAPPAPAAGTDTHTHRT
jgi:hypothetical protein